MAAAGVVIVLSAIETFTADPSQGEGWIGGPIEAVFAGGPLILIAVGLRSDLKRTAVRTAVAALLLACVVGFILVMQVLDPNENNLDRAAQAAAALVYLAAFAVEVPAFGSGWPSDDRPPAR
ncbi:MAG TPA: hypothetical protein VFN68_04225 [Acidimicrobiales bacterium]|nr:hypothetical protein [Acidimicrobiales bacterium]